MLAIGGLEVLVFMVVVYGLAALALYWIVRLAVRHGIADSRRSSQARESAVQRQQRTDEGRPD